MRPIPRTLSYLIPATVLAAVVGLWSPPIDRQAPASPPATTGLPNLHSLGADLWTGGMPDADQGFRSLRNLGIKTVISVDGIRPDVERAHRFGLRYVHLPVEYGGISHQRVLQLARAAEASPRPMYIHCHHGQHRGPAAAAIMRRCGPDGWSADEAVAFLHSVGTDPKYEGLFANVRDLTPPTARELQSVPATFPEVAAVPDLTARMVEIDELWDALKRARANGWQSPIPSESVAHLALRINEQFREVGRLTGRFPPTEGFSVLRDDAQDASDDLQAALRGGDTVAADKAYIRTAAVCADCHRDYRDHKRPSPSSGR